jgi:hypothetical protein
MHILRSLKVTLAEKKSSLGMRRHRNNALSKDSASEALPKKPFKKCPTA